MITLYIKTHRQTGLKYFGKTTCDDPYRYKGGGKVWRRHLMKHGYDFDTEIYLQSENQEYITQEALRFSWAYDIVKSSLWANLQEENGIDGWTKGNPNLKLKGVPRSSDAREKMSKGRMGIKMPPRSKEHCENLSKSLTGIPKSKEQIEKFIKARARTWLVIDPNENEYIVVNMNKFCKENGLDQRHMSHVASGKHKHHKGWKCRKVETK